VDEQDESRRDQQSIEALEHGGLPVSAEARIAESEARGGAWTSDLSVAELAAVRRWGFEPAGMVMGTSVYHIGSQWGRSWYASLSGAYTSQYPCPHGYYMGSNEHRTGYNWEHTVHERGMVEARNLAMSRMLEEARELGAHGVVGVRLQLEHFEGVASAVEFNAVGTAIRRHGAPPLPTPFTSDLSGQDFAKLLSGGYVPVALVMGICAMEVDPGCGMEWNMSSWGNVELNQYTDAAQQCREIAMAHLEREVAGVGADGVVGVSVRFTEHELSGESKIFQLLAVGTAVARFAGTPLPEPPLAILKLGAR